MNKLGNAEFNYETEANKSKYVYYAKAVVCGRGEGWETQHESRRRECDKIKEMAQCLGFQFLCTQQSKKHNIRSLLASPGSTREATPPIMQCLQTGRPGTTCDGRAKHCAFVGLPPGMCSPRRHFESVPSYI